jgi:HNH endonuclease
MPSSYTNKKKSKEQLGMPYSTAYLRLQKRILFFLAKECDRLNCFRCGKEIETIEDFSIDHKEPWLDKSPELFFDVNNIAFSHLICNMKAGRKPTQWSQAAVDGWNKKHNTDKRKVKKIVEEISEPDSRGLKSEELLDITKQRAVEVAGAAM